MRLEMKTANRQGLLRLLHHPRTLLLSSGALSAVVFAAACMGTIGTGGGPAGELGATSGNGSGTTGATGGMIGGKPPTVTSGASSGAAAAAGTPQTLDPGTVG